MFNRAGPLFNESYIFGREGEGYERINLACPRALLAKALDRLASAVKAL